jgi:uncharacterized protein (DUF427 family)
MSDSVSANPAPGFAKHPGYEVVIEPLTATLTVRVGNHTIAESTRAVSVLETRHRPVWYIPLEDINASCITATDTDTYCPFKGHASYFSVTIPGQTPDTNLVDAIWVYQSPYDQCQALRGYASFYTNKVDLFIDGEMANKEGPGWQD